MFQQRIAVAMMLGLDTAVPCRDVMVTRVDRRVYLGIRGAGFVRLRGADARELAGALDQLAQAIEAENQAPGSP